MLVLNMIEFTSIWLGGRYLGISTPGKKDSWATCCQGIAVISMPVLMLAWREVEESQ